MPDKRVHFADFELDFGRFQLCRSGRPLPVEGLPLQLLMFIIENRDCLVTRERIAEALWGPDVFVDVEQGINTAVRKIRIALEDDSAQPQYLRTVVGRGYRFVAPVREEKVREEKDNMPATAEEFKISAEEFGQAIMAAAGLDPRELEARRRMRSGS
jgi:DNA-binding winged helix-turn-helix (wHTH) protein